MKAYINKNGHVIAVFLAMGKGRYKIYIRYENKSDFRGLPALKSYSAATREEAEQCADEFISKSKDRTWRLCERWVG